jgi:apolipoprotein N-acyltransferase
MSFELLHLHWDFSWPWFQLGNVFSETTSWIQWYEYTGVFGGSLWVWIVNILCFQALREPSVEFRKLAFCVVAIAIPISFSLLIYSNHKPQNNTTIEVVIAQPNIDPYEEKFVASDLEQSKSLFELISPKLTPTTDLILAPETYFTEGFGSYLPSFLSSPLYQTIQEEIDQIGTVQLMTGIQFYQVYTESDKTTTSNQFGDQWVDFYNSAFLSGTNPLQVYHKSKLVVGVETLPYKEFIEPLLGNIMLDLGGTVRSRATGIERSVFQLNKEIKVAPIICYESVYGSFVSGFVRNGAEFLAVMTNDAWWGTTPGHRQLLSYTKLRAIETRLPIVRSANSGISAVIDTSGEVIQQIPYLERGVMTSTITPQKQITFYVLYGDYIARLSLFISILLLLLAIARKKLTFR